MSGACIQQPGQLWGRHPFVAVENPNPSGRDGGGHQPSIASWQALSLPCARLSSLTFVGVVVFVANLEGK